MWSDSTASVLSKTNNTLRLPNDHHPSQLNQQFSNQSELRHPKNLLETMNEPKDEFDPQSIDSEFIDHSSLVLKKLESLYLNEDFSDITLMVQGQPLPVHRVILASSSDYFRALLYGGLQESQSNEINLKCEHLDLFKKLLRYVYTGLDLNC